MKLRTSFFDAPVFKKNLTRFAPAWGLYTLCLLLGLMIMGGSGLEYWLPANLADCLQIMPLVNGCYALLVAQLIFGDLFNTRMCNALHALPLRRETWFATNAVSGLVFSLGPTLVMTLIALPLVSMSRVTDAWQIPLLWLLGTNLQYLFFFGSAVLCVFCVGNRFAMAVLYAIVNLGANVIYWLADTIYVPLLYGIRTQYDAFLPFFPLGQMMNQPYFVVERHYDEGGVAYNPIWGEFTLTEGWGYLWICAGLALVMVALALLLYRRRKLECAGDFMAVRSLEPVFLGLYCLVAAAFFHIACALFLGDGGYLFLFIGLAVGFFTGRMLLERRVNVFRGKNWLALGVTVLAVAASMLLTWLDPLGVETWIPKAESVDRAVLSLGHDNWHGNASLPIKDPEDIDNILFIHEQAISGRAEEQYDSTVGITITYELDNGTTVNRYYTVWTGGEDGRLLRKYFSSLYCVTGTDDLVGKQGTNTFLNVDGWDVPQEYLSRESVRELLEAIEADCAAGTMTQDWGFHQGKYIFESANYSIHVLYLDLMTGDIATQFQIYGDSEHTLAWMEEHGVLDYVWEKCYGEKFG